MAGNTAMKTSVDDPSQPEWLKVRSLQEIETIRDAQKEQIITHQFLNKKGSHKYKCDVIQGGLSFVRIPVCNRSRDIDVFNVQIMDPDQASLLEPEFVLVSDPTEVQYWQQQNRLKLENNLPLYSGPESI